MIEIKIGKYILYSEDETFNEFNKKLEEITIIAKMTDYAVDSHNDMSKLDVLYEVENEDKALTLVCNYTLNGHYLRSIRLVEWIGMKDKVISQWEIREGERNWEVLRTLDTMKKHMILERAQSNE